MNRAFGWRNEAPIHSAYQQHYQFVPARDDTLKRHCYRIRHEVYCRELRYEPLRRDGIEVDGYDTRSLHCLVRATQTEEFIGCARLVLHSTTQPFDQFPLERACGTLSQRTQDFIGNNRSKIAEVSRLAISPGYRKRTGRAATMTSGVESGAGPSKSRLPHLALGLYLAMAALASENEIRHLLFLTEPSLVAGVATLGWKPVRVGEPIHHRGIRVPYMLDLDQMITNMDSYIGRLYQAIRHEIGSRSRQAGVQPPRDPAQVTPELANALGAGI